MPNDISPWARINKTELKIIDNQININFDLFNFVFSIWISKKIPVKNKSVTHQAIINRLLNKSAVTNKYKVVQAGCLPSGASHIRQKLEIKGIPRALSKTNKRKIRPSLTKSKINDLKYSVIRIILATEPLQVLRYRRYWFVQSQKF